MGSSTAEQLHQDDWSGLTAEELASLEYDWPFWARPEQRQPEGDWLIWLILAGRGFGKTRTGGETTKEVVDSGEVERVALVGPTAADCRDVMVLGESGILASYPRLYRPRFESSKRRVTFHNGAIATLYSAEEPDRLRGPQHGFAWGDEIAAWKNIDDTWSNLQLGLRLGARPRAMFTTTPRPIPILKDLVTRAITDPAIRVTRGSTFANAANLPASFISDVQRAYGGTRLGRQELWGEILGDAEGALFRREWILRSEPPPLESMRVVVGLDPAITVRNDETGIVVVGRVGDRAYVLEDRSGTYSPNEWAAISVDLCKRYRAVAIVAETNRGGDLVSATIRSAVAEGQRVPVIREVRASTGKDTRAEPIAALYEQRRVTHCGTFGALEEQMTTWDPTSIEAARERKQATSPDRMDALVWAMTDLGFHLRAVSFRGGVTTRQTRN